MRHLLLIPIMVLGFALMATAQPLPQNTDNSTQTSNCQAQVVQLKRENQRLKTITKKTQNENEQLKRRLAILERQLEANTGTNTGTGTRVIDRYNDRKPNTRTRTNTRTNTRGTCEPNSRRTNRGKSVKTNNSELNKYKNGNGKSRGKNNKNKKANDSDDDNKEYKKKNRYSKNDRF